MAKRLLLLLMMCSACGGKLSDEQRQRLREGMSTQDIKRVTDADMQEAALNYGQQVLVAIEEVDRFLLKKSKIDSLQKVYEVNIYSLTPSDSALRKIEKELLDAYMSDGNLSNIGNNIQKVGEDSLLLTKPVFKERPDGSQEFSYAIGIRMAKKTIVLSMPKP